ncbi:MAG: nuclear transport factor 2 family protein [Rhodobiaceae bacterium]|nr:nuclear transport factor 2 family protein [Rhodobiaceae bacterium]MCC0055962.1 nuclear transport factor 2 family protein [Rhodobiaceae bacterium]
MNQATETENDGPLRTVNAYLHGVDMKDRAAIAAVFHKDAETIYNAGAVDQFSVSGRDAIVAQLFEIIDGFGPTVHALANYGIATSGGDTKVDSVVVAHVLKGGNLTMRGLVYSDTMVRGGDNGWVIVRREHRPLWQTVTPAGETRLP